MQTNPADGPSGGDPAAELDEATDVEGKVGHSDLRSRPGETDRADDQSHGLFLYREHVFDRSPARVSGWHYRGGCVPGPPGRVWSCRPRRQGQERRATGRQRSKGWLPRVGRAWDGVK